MKKGDKAFTLYWRTGRREVVHGRDVAEAMTLAGYSYGAWRALDFHASGEDNNWKYVPETREWVASAQ